MANRLEVLNVQAKEGLPIGLAVSVRYRLDATRLVFIHNTLPSAVDSEVVQPVIGSTFRGIAPNYTVREVFAGKREEIRQRASDEITHKLGADGIVVKEVMLREVQLPPEYAKGLEGLLLKEQENDQMSVQAEIKQKEVRVAEYEADADKVREEKRAEASAKVRVLQAKAEADAMQYTLPLKEKQIQQTRLESEARKEATIKNAEASAQAKVIDSKAELERRNLLADAEANRIRVTAKADLERMQGEAAMLKQSPLLINKIIAERLSDKLQIMMVPADGKYFFASDVLRGQMPQLPSPRQLPRSCGRWTKLTIRRSPGNQDELALRAHDRSRGWRLPLPGRCHPRLPVAKRNAIIRFSAEIRASRMSSRSQRVFLALLHSIWLLGDFRRCPGVGRARA